MTRTVSLDASRVRQTAASCHPAPRSVPPRAPTTATQAPRTDAFDGLRKRPRSPIDDSRSNGSTGSDVLCELAESEASPASGESAGSYLELLYSPLRNPLGAEVDASDGEQINPSSYDFLYASLIETIIADDDDGLRGQPPLKKLCRTLGDLKCHAEAADPMQDIPSQRRRMSPGASQEALLFLEIDRWLHAGTEPESSRVEEAPYASERPACAWTDQLSDELLMRVANYLGDADRMRFALSDKSAYRVVQTTQQWHALIDMTSRIHVPDRTGLACLEALLRTCGPLAPPAHDVLGECLVRLAQCIDRVPDLKSRLHAFRWLANAAHRITPASAQPGMRRALADARVIMGNRDGETVTRRLNDAKSAMEYAQRGVYQPSRDPVLGAEETMKFAQRLFALATHHRTPLFVLLVERAENMPEAMRPVFMKVLAQQLFSLQQGHRLEQFQSLVRISQRMKPQQRIVVRPHLAASICQLRPGEWWRAFHEMCEAEPQSSAADKAQLLKTMLQFPRSEQKAPVGRAPIALWGPRDGSRPPRLHRFQPVQVAEHLDSFFEAASGLEPAERRIVLAFLVQKSLGMLTQRARVHALRRLMDMMPPGDADLPWIDAFVQDIYVADQNRSRRESDTSDTMFSAVLGAVLEHRPKCALSLLQSFARQLGQAPREERLFCFKRLCEAAADFDGDERVALLCALGGARHALHRRNWVGARTAVADAADGMRASHRLAVLKSLQA